MNHSLLNTTTSYFNFYILFCRKSFPIVGKAFFVTIDTNRKDESHDYQIFYGILTNGVDWNGAKAVDGKMVAGMYPVLERDVKVMLNPTGVDATDYNFEFRASDNVALWGLKFGDMEPYAGEKLTRTASESGIWVLPREIDRVDLNELNERADYITQFKENDGNSYAFALMATAKDDASQVVKSQYIYSFDPKNIGDMDAKDFKWNQLKNNYKWGTFHTPDFEDYSWNNSGAVGDIDLPVYLSQVIYDYKLEIDKTKMSQVDIDKYGLQVSEDGYTFAATKEAAVDNWVYFKLSYILVNGSKYTTTYRARITANDIEVVDQQIGTINEAFNATYMTGSLITQLNNHYVLPAQEIKFSPKEVLGANYDEWIDALHKNLSGRTDAQKANVLKAYATVTGGDPINNDAAYNMALISNLVYFDYVDANGKSCIYNVQPTDVLSRLADIAAMKVYFIAGTYNKSTNNIGQNEVVAPYYTVTGTTAWQNGFAIPLNNAFTVEVGTAKEEQIVAKYSFKFQLTQPDIKTVGIVPQDGEFTKWTPKSNGEQVLYSFGAYGETDEKDDSNMYLPLHEAFDMWIAKDQNKYASKNTNAKYYDLKFNYELSDISGVTFMNSDNYTETHQLDELAYQGTWWNYGTYADKFGGVMSRAISDNAEASVTVNVNYHFFGVYPALADQLPFYIDRAGNKQSGFHLVFASTIQKSTLKMNEDIYYANAGTNDVFITNDDVTATTYLGRNFVLFDGLKDNKRWERATLNNERGFNEAQRPFAEPKDYEVSAQYVNGGGIKSISIVEFDNNTNGKWVVDARGVKTYELGKIPSDASIKIYAIPSIGETKNGNVIETAHTGGLAIQLGKGIEDRQPINITIKIKDTFGFYQTLNVKVQKLQN